MAEYNTVDIFDLAKAAEEFGPIAYQDILGNDFIADSVSFDDTGVDTVAFITARHYLAPNNRMTIRVVAHEEFYALIPHRMDSVVLHDSVVKAMESVYAAMMAVNGVDQGTTKLDWAYQNSIYGDIERVLFGMLLSISDDDSKWANSVLESIMNAGEVRHILGNYTSTNTL